MARKYPEIWGTNTIILKQGHREGRCQWSRRGSRKLEKIRWQAFDLAETHGRPLVGVSEIEAVLPVQERHPRPRRPPLRHHGRNDLAGAGSGASGSGTQRGERHVIQWHHAPGRPPSAVRCPAVHVRPERPHRDYRSEIALVRRIPSPAPERAAAAADDARQGEGDTRACSVRGTVAHIAQGRMGEMTRRSEFERGSSR